ncbi:MAG: RNA methyltransferase [Gemmatimonadetes bacterium]|nr:RNA methyltransferase [Gemmatimonadota bacterium]MYB60080.1 RNA methyltransferase [Gemmatimonadota bacterium]
MADRTESTAPDYFSHIHIILVEPKVPGNIGAVARSMTTMGLSRLVLVDPVEFRHEAEARWMAHGAGDILDNARVVPTLDEAVNDLALVVGTTNRTRGIWLSPIQPVEDACAELSAVARGQPCGILFGREDRGLLNDELQRCNVIARIPAATAYPSLNLAQSVMVCAYELFRQSAEVPPPSDVRLADHRAVERVTRRVHETLLRLGFESTPNEETFLRTIRRVLRRSLRLEQRDVAVLHKVCDEIDAYVDRRGGGQSDPQIPNSEG